MMHTTLLLATLLLCIPFTVLPTLVRAADSEPHVDVWSGRYQVQFMGKSVRDDAPKAIWHIKPSQKKRQGRGGVELACWTVTSESADDQTEICRFSDDDKVFYKDLGLVPGAETECLGGAFVFICRVKPGATVTDGPDKILVRTGFLGAIVDFGLIELTKLAY